MVTLIRYGGDGYNHGSAHKEFLVDQQSDLSEISEFIAPGSVAYLADRSKEWVYTQEGTWVEKQASGGGADWNASEGEPGFVANRPGGYDEMSVLYDSTVDLSNGIGNLNVDLTSAEKIIVAFDDADYGVSGNGFQTMKFFGNMAIVSMGANTGEPFLIMASQESTGAQIMTTKPGEHQITIKTENAVKIPEKYLPEMPKVLEFGTVISHTDIDNVITHQSDSNVQIYIGGVRVKGIGYETDTTVTYTRIDTGDTYRMTFDDISDAFLAPGNVTWYNPRSSGGIQLVYTDNDTGEPREGSYVSLELDDSTGPICYTYTTADGSMDGGYLYPLPKVTANMNGKVLGVVNGKLAWVDK